MSEAVDERTRALNHVRNDGNNLNFPGPFLSDRAETYESGVVFPDDSAKSSLYFRLTTIRFKYAVNTYVREISKTLCHRHKNGPGSWPGK